MQKKKRWLRIGRIAFYAALLLFFALLPYDAAAHGFYVCPSTYFGLQCPGCGVTRAMTLLMKFRIAEAWEMNQIFTAFLFPAFLLVAGQDTAYILLKKKYSFVEHLLWLDDGFSGEDEK